VGLKVSLRGQGLTLYLTKDVAEDGHGVCVHSEDSGWVLREVNWWAML
jgi:hypothetical protein